MLGLRVLLRGRAREALPSRVEGDLVAFGASRLVFGSAVGDFETVARCRTIRGRDLGGKRWWRSCRALQLTF